MSRKRKRNNASNNTNLVEVYSKSDYRKDEDNFNQSLKKGELDIKSFQRLMIRDMCIKTKILDNGCIGDIKIEDAMSALRHPKQGWRTLMAISDELMRVSPHYFRMNSLFSNMALFCWGLDVYDVKENIKVEVLKKIYGNLAAKLETMNLKHEFSKIMKYIPYQDIYCGLIFENANDFFIQKIDFKLCKLYEIEDGLYNFIINLSAIDCKKLSAYPDYVQQAYIDYTENNGTNWYMPPSDKQICIKLNSQWIYPYPILIGLIKDILDLDIYKKLKLQSARTDNYKAILVEVPIDTETVDKPLLTPQTLAIMAEINRESMTDDIGLIHTFGSKGEAVSFKDSSNTRNNVSDAVDELYNAAGETKELYNGSASGTAVTFSVENDSGFIYGLYRQFERWINRFIKLRKYNKSAFKFAFYLLDITIFNRDKVSDRYKNACTLGVTVVDKWLATLDMTPSKMMGSFILHKQILNYADNFMPLNSSYNSSNNEAGRPTNASKNEVLDVEGEKTANGEKNDS